MNKKLFGTDGIRGLYGKKITPELMFKVGQAVASIYKDQLTKVKILIGRDTRTTSLLLQNAIISGAMSIGADVISVGIVPSSGVSFLCKQKLCHCGIMITASHNGPEFNGIKIFNGNGYKLTDTQEKQIEQLIFENNFVLKDYKSVGNLKINKKIKDKYINFLVSCKQENFEDLNIIVDCSNGASTEIIDKVLKKLNVNYKLINKRPIGHKINLNLITERLRAIKKHLKHGKYDLGFAFDGDADRLTVINNNGNLISGDDILLILGKHYFNKDELVNNTVVGTVMTNYYVENEFKNCGINLVRTSVGDKFVINEMLKQNYTFGGEESGHFIFYNLAPTADAILSLIMVLNFVKNSGKNLSHLVTKIKRFPQVKINIKINEEKKQKIMSNADLKKLIKQCQNELLNNGRLVVRASGTEPVIRILVEGSDKNKIIEVADKLKKIIKKL